MRLWIARSTFFFFASAACRTAAAADAVPVVFEQPQDVLMIWAERAGLVAMVISAALTLYVLAARGRRITDGQSKWLLFIGLCVLPIPVAFLGGGVGMEQSKQVDFCASCHKPMGPFITDMKAPKSDHLAAMHYKNWYIHEDHCWTCHTDYGVAGTITAKLTGLNHISRVALGAWDPPIKLYGPYNWTICLVCHANSALFRAPRADADAHEGVLASVMKGGAGCTDCHKSAHPGREKRASR